MVVIDHALDDTPSAVAPRLEELHDADALANALAVRDPERGMLQDATPVTITAPVKVYRVFNGSKPWTKAGNWWSFYDPYLAMTKREFRDAYVICDDWSPLTKHATATLRAGAVVLLGSGQSAECTDAVTLHDSPAQQVYVVSPDISFVGDIATKDMVWRA